MITSSSSLYLPADDIWIVLPGVFAIEVFPRKFQEQPSYNCSHQSASRSTDQCVRPEAPTAPPNTQLTICRPGNMCFKISIFYAVAPGKKLIWSLASFRLITITPSLPIETKDFDPSTNIYYYQHHDMHSAPGMSLALSQLDAYIEIKGPFRLLTRYRSSHHLSRPAQSAISFETFTFQLRDLLFRWQYLGYLGLGRRGI